MLGSRAAAEALAEGQRAVRSATTEWDRATPHARGAIWRVGVCSGEPDSRGHLCERADRQPRTFSAGRKVVFPKTRWQCLNSAGEPPW